MTTDLADRAWLASHKQRIQRAAFAPHGQKLARLAEVKRAMTERLRQEMGARRMKVAFALALLLAASPAFAQPPGALNPAVTPATLGDTICKRGWAASVRPPFAWTDIVKKLLAAVEGVNLHAVILDHLVPIELGGAPANIKNLQLQRPDEAARKDDEENRLNHLVCSGRMSLGEAQEAIRRWRP